MWQAEADTELTLSALPATAVGEILLEYGTLTCLFETTVLLEDTMGIDIVTMTS